MLQCDKIRVQGLYGYNPELPNAEYTQWSRKNCTKFNVPSPYNRSPQNQAAFTKILSKDH